LKPNLYDEFLGAADDEEVIVLEPRQIAVFNQPCSSIAASVSSAPVIALHQIGPAAHGVRRSHPSGTAAAALPYQFRLDAWP